MTAFIDEFREAFGVEPICRILPIAPSTCHAQKAVNCDLSRASARARRDDELKSMIRQVRTDNRELSGARKIWHALMRKNVDVARCTVERLVREMGLRGVVRGQKIVTTTPDTARPRSDDKLCRAFHAERPDQPWVSYQRAKGATHLPPPHAPAQPPDYGTMRGLGGGVGWWEA